MNLIQSLAGMLGVEITSGDLGNTLCMAASQGIVLYEVEPAGPLCTRCRICRRDYSRLLRLCRKRGDRLEIQKKPGLYWTGRRLLRRPLLSGGILALTAFFLFLPTRILFLEVEGNQTVPTAAIREAAENSGIHFGVSRRSLRSEQIKNSILQQLPTLSWAGVNTRGCVARLTVRERSPEPTSPGNTVSGITAVRDGIVDSCTALRGTLLCQPGQAVTQGQLLISGYTDCGGVIKAGAAEGEIFARTSRLLTLITPDSEIRREGQTRQKQQWGLLIGKKAIKFPWNSGILDTSCGRMYAEYYITLPGGYRLPVAVTRNTYTVSGSRISQKKPAALEARLAEDAARYLRSQMIAGTILSGRQNFRSARGAYVLQGQYLCREMIGRNRQEKIGE